MLEISLTKIWVTRWALTKGIIQVEASLSKNGKMAVYTPEVSALAVYVHAGDFHLTEELAIQRAYIMRAKKIQALNTQLKKLQKLSFLKME